MRTRGADAVEAASQRRGGGRQLIWAAIVMGTCRGGGRAARTLSLTVLVTSTGPAHDEPCCWRPITMYHPGLGAWICSAGPMCAPGGHSSNSAGSLSKPGPPVIRGFLIGMCVKLMTTTTTLVSACGGRRGALQGPAGPRSRPRGSQPLRRHAGKRRRVTCATAGPGSRPHERLTLVPCFNASDIGCDVRRRPPTCLDGPGRRGCASTSVGTDARRVDIAST